MSQLSGFEAFARAYLAGQARVRTQWNGFVVATTLDDTIWHLDEMLRIFERRGDTTSYAVVAGLRAIQKAREEVS